MKNIYLGQTGIHATLTTWIYTGMWQLYAATKSGHRGYIHWPQMKDRSLSAYQDPAQFSTQPNMFDWYFKQRQLGTPLFTVPPADETWLWEESHDELSTYPLMGMPLDMIKTWYREQLGFSDAVYARGEQLVTKYNLEFSKLIGLSWRGTDIYLDGRPYLPIEVYYPFLDKILAEEPECRIACTAEEEGILDPLLKKYPQAFKIDEFLASPKGCKENPERFTAVRGFERGMQPALMVWLFSKCKHYIKNRSSTGAVASWLSTGNIISLAHPENLGHGPHPAILHPVTGQQIWP